MNKLNLKHFLDKIFTNDPEELISIRLINMPVTQKIALYSSLISTLLAHGYFFLNRFVNEDSIWRITIHPGQVRLGRWFADAILPLSGRYNLPWVLGIFATIYLIFSCMLIVSILGIKSKVYAAIIPLLIIAFPSWSIHFPYDFQLELAPSALLFSTLAIYFTKKFKHGYIIGSISLMLSLALYQSFLGFAIGLSIILILKYVLEEKRTLKLILSQVLRYALCGILGIAMYLVSVRISVLFSGQALSAYRGIDTMGQISIQELPYLLLRSFAAFFMFFTGDRFFQISSALIFLNYAVAVVIILILLQIIINKKLYKSVNILFVILSLAFLPIGLNIVDIIARPATDLQINQFVLAIILVFVLCEINTEALSRVHVKVRHISKYTVIILTLLIGMNYLVRSGTNYFVYHVYFERTSAFYNRVLSRIESVEGYNADFSVAFIGQAPFLNFDRSTPLHDISGSGIWRVRPFVGVGDPTKMRAFIDHYLGVSLTLATPSEIQHIRSTEAFADMPPWPEDGAVQVIDNVIVVKLNYDPMVRIESLGEALHLISNGIHRLPENSQFAWYIFHEHDVIEVIWYQEGLSSFEFKFDEPGRYRVEMFVRNSDGSQLLTSVSSAWFIFEP